MQYATEFVFLPTPYYDKTGVNHIQRKLLRLVLLQDSPNTKNFKFLKFLSEFKQNRNRSSARKVNTLCSLWKIQFHGEGSEDRNPGWTLHISPFRFWKRARKIARKKRFSTGNASPPLYSMKGGKVEDFRGFGDWWTLVFLQRGLCQRVGRNGLRMIGWTGAGKHLRRIKNAAMSTRDNAVAK